MNKAGGCLLLADIVEKLRDCEATSITNAFRCDAPIASVFEPAKGRADALYVYAGPVTSLNRTRIFALALAMRFPTISGLRLDAQGGSLMS